MCGRYVIEGPTSRLTEYFDAKLLDEYELRTSYNVAPTTRVPVIRINRDGLRVVLEHRWGLVPSWAEGLDIGAKLTNARGETVHEKPSFRTAFKKRRCLIPATGYYEWQAPPENSKQRKQPYYFSPKEPSTPYFAMAGICEHWRSLDDELVMTAAIITIEATQEITHIHDRMPVMLDRENWTQWLDPSNDDVESLRQLLRPSKQPQFWPVGLEISAVGKGRVDMESLISLKI